MSEDDRPSVTLIGRFQKRPFYPCDVYHMAGSIADKDVRLKAVDAVVAIEIIEHLSPTDLERFPQAWPLTPFLLDSSPTLLCPSSIFVTTAISGGVQSVLLIHFLFTQR